jgi:hypothetical protein
VAAAARAGGVLEVAVVEAATAAAPGARAGVLRSRAARPRRGSQQRERAVPPGPPVRRQTGLVGVRAAGLTAVVADPLPEARGADRESRAAVPSWADRAAGREGGPSRADRKADRAVPAAEGADRAADPGGRAADPGGRAADPGGRVAGRAGGPSRADREADRADPEADRAHRAADPGGREADREDGEDPAVLAAVPCPADRGVDLVDPEARAGEVGRVDPVGRAVPCPAVGADQGRRADRAYPPVAAVPRPDPLPGPTAPPVSAHRRRGRSPK